MQPDLIGVTITILGIGVALAVQGQALIIQGSGLDRKKTKSELIKLGSLGKTARLAGFVLVVFGFIWGAFAAWKLWGPWSLLSMLLYIVVVGGTFWALTRKL